ncbi:recombination regulator RecX [Serratia sp. DD3]|uniref:recombination regulator RecX n=1 Tax=Serratia sp. DD3 TaxID=1410619 RepID=UPI0003C4E129|nr:recombination regulator RecX [Serratia sp. DD3]KEY58202.1 regulatory protein RecX [Serratia sp. DD3]
MNEVTPQLFDKKENILISRVMRWLSQRDHSEAELRRKLAVPPGVENLRFGAAKRPVEPTAPIDPAMIERLIAYCYQHNWLDDRRFADSFIASRSRKGYGAQRIVSELVQKGVEKEIVQAALAECPIDWCELARKVALHKFGDPLPVEWKEKAKVLRYLLYRGFFQEEIQSIYRDFV